MLKAYCVIKNFSEEAVNILKLSGIDLEISKKDSRPSEEELKELVQKYDILIIGVKEKMTPEVFLCANRLKVLGTLSIGLDHISKEFLESDKIKVFNCPTANVISVAEHTFSMILALQKRLIETNTAVINKKGREDIINRPNDLFGKTIGIIGAGKIATEVIRLSNAFNMKILLYTFNPNSHLDLEKNFNVKFVDLDNLLKKSDIISIHMPLSDLTKELIDEEKIRMMKESAIFINTSREQIVDTNYLMQHVDEHPNFRVGLDIDTDNFKEIFAKCRENAIITPHLAGISMEASVRMDVELSKSIRNYLEGESLW